jgi:hypothetical protein
MRFRSGVPKLAFLLWRGLFSLFFHGAKKAPVFCLLTTLVLTLFIPSAIAQPFTNAPIFQFAVFYNLDLDASPGQPMTIRGKVFSNGNIYLYPYASMTFNELVMSAKTIYTNLEDPKGDQQTTSGYVAPTFKASWISNYSPLVMPIGSNSNPAYAESIINLPGAGIDQNSSNALNYPYFTADLIISNAPTGTNLITGTTAFSGTCPNLIVNSTNVFIFCTNIFVWWQNGFNTSPRLTLLTNDVVITNPVIQGAIYKSNFVYAGYSFATNVNFYDFRENDQVYALQIDMAKFSAWLTNKYTTNSGAIWDTNNVNVKNHHISSIYVYNNITPASGSPGRMPGVRLVNGAQLPYLGSPDGLTVVTPQPLYVLGNYNIQTNDSGANSFGTNNTAYTVPAALMADAITILSSNWNDTQTAYKRGGSLTSRTPAATTINAACLEGIVESTTVGSQQYYSGGLENFLRLEENWSTSIPLTYNGSIVVMFPSIYATNFWQVPGAYYNPPSRNWSFDLLYTNSARLPPLTPLLLNNTNPPVISVQPTNQTVLAGGTAIFSAMVTNCWLPSYQWYFNSARIASATNSAYMITNVNTNDAGAYQVIIASLFGGMTSSVATLTVVLPPTITVQPASQVVVSGNNVTFSVTVTGTGPFTYQWQLNGTNLPNSIITTVAGNGTNAYAGDGGPAINASLSYPGGMGVDTVGNLYIADCNNNYVRKVDTNGIITTIAGNGNTGYSGDGGAATNASLWNPSFVSPDEFGNLYVADYKNLRIRKIDANGIITTVAGNGVYGYAGDGGAATSASFCGVDCVVVDTAGNLYIADSLNARIRKIGTNGIITTVAGNGSPGYSGDGGPATEASLFLPLSVAVDAIGNLYIADTWGERIRKVGTNGIITTVAGNGVFGYAGDGGQATNANLYSPRSVSVDATGNLYIDDRDNYRIRKVDTNGIITTIAGNGTNGYAGDGGAATNGSFSSAGAIVVAADDLFIADTINQRVRAVEFTGNPTLALYNVSSANAGNYTVVITSPYGSVTSSNVVLFVLPPPVIVTQPTNQTVAVGQMAAFMVFAAPPVPGGCVPLSYQWQFNGTNLDGATNAVLTLSNVQLIDSGNYTVVVTDLYGSVASSNAVLTVIEQPPLILVQPTNQTVFVNDTLSFSVTVTGSLPLSYQWNFNGTDIDGATNATLTLVGVQTNQAGTYLVQVTNTFGSIASSNAVLTVLVPPSIITQPTGCTNVVGATANFNVVADGTAPLNYQWSFNGTNLGGATNVTLMLTNVTADQAGVYSVTITNMAGSVTSSNAVLSVYATTAATLNGCSFACDNGFLFQVAGIPGFNYAVQVSTNLIDWVSLITNASPFCFTDANATNSPQQFYRTFYVP